MFKRIYVAIDQSEFSKQALIAATKIAHAFQASLCLGHCIADDTSSNQEVAQKFLESTKSQIGGVGEIEVRILVADAQYGLNGISSAIAQSACDWQSDLLVVGTSNRKGLDRFFLGSVAEELVSKIDFPIMLFKIS